MQQTVLALDNSPTTATRTNTPTIPPPPVSPPSATCAGRSGSVDAWLGVDPFRHSNRSALQRGGPVSAVPPPIGYNARNEACDHVPADCCFRRNVGNWCASDCPCYAPRQTAESIVAQYPAGTRRAGRMRVLRSLVSQPKMKLLEKTP
jgi:hypothetical protein